MKKDININGKFSCKIIIKNMEFSKILSRYVSRSNLTSGKVNVPEDLIGKEVMVCLPKKVQKRKKMRKKK